MTETFKIGCKYKDSIEYERIRCKVRYYNSCNIFLRLLLGLVHGRNFIPTANEKHLVYLMEKNKKPRRKGK